MKRLMQVRAGLVGLMLVAGCAVSHAQSTAPSPTPAGNGPVASSAGPGLPADIPLRRDTDTPAVQNGPWAFALWGLVVLAGATWVLARRRRQAAATGQRTGWNAWIKGTGNTDGNCPTTVGQTRLTPRHSLHAVQWRGVEYLIGCSDQGMQLMAQRPVDDTRPDGENTP